MGRHKETPAERNKRMPADPHGTPLGYTYWGCRLDCCRTAHREWSKSRPKKKPKIRDDEHGTARNYARGCHCDACREANRLAAKAKREARRGPAIPDDQLLGIRRYNYPIDAGPAARAALAQAFGAARFVYNSYVELSENAFEAGLPRPTVADARTILVTERKQTDEYSWMDIVATSVLYGALNDCDTAYKNFFDSITGKRQGPAIEKPTFKKYSARKSAYFHEDAYRIRGGWKNTEPGGGRLWLAKIGHVSVNWHRPLPSHPSSVTIIERADGALIASFVVKVPKTDIPDTTNPGRIAGIDLGLADFATIVHSDGTREKIPNLRPLAAAEKKLKRADREFARATKRSANRENSRLRRAALHQRVADIRHTHHQQLAARLCRDNDIIVVESLAIDEMIADAKPWRRKAIYDTGWRYFLDALTVKAAATETLLIAADRYFPSTQLCSACGKKSGPTDTRIRVWTCPCGTTLDRDYNAATNLMMLGLPRASTEVRAEWDDDRRREVSGPDAGNNMP